MSPEQAEFDERAAVLEYDHDLSRAAAEAQAVREIYDRLIGGDRYPGIVDELIRAGRRLWDSELAPALEGLGLASARAPLWGLATIVAEDRTYRPALDGEAGTGAIVVPAACDGAIIDLVAQAVNSPKRRLRTRLDMAALVGADQVEPALAGDQPLLVFEDLSAWLRGHCLGAVIVDWRRAGGLLDGVRTILCSRCTAPALHEATRRCQPTPTIAVPRPKETCHAA